MKRAIGISVFLLLSVALFAQARGVPASVLSYGPGRGMAPGPPASVLSLGPNGYSAPCYQAGCAYYYPAYPFNGSNAFHSGQHHGGSRGGHGGNGGRHNPGQSGGYSGGYLYVPYAVPVAVEPDEPIQPDEPEPPAPTIFEHRSNVQPPPYADDQSRYGEHYLDSREYQPVSDPRPSAPVAATAPSAPVKATPVVIVFKDGHQQEISNGNYAIVGDMLYDLSGSIARKIKLSDLDLKRTTQQNEDRGVEFSVPASYKPEA